METAYTSERLVGDNLSTAVPAWTKSSSYDSEDSVSSASLLIVADDGHDHGSTVAPRTTDAKAQIKSSGVSVLRNVDSSNPTLSSEDPSFTTSRLHLNSTVEMRLRESSTLPAQNTSLPVGTISVSVSQTSVKTKAGVSSLLLNSKQFTTYKPVRADTVMSSKHPRSVSQTHISKDISRTSVLDADAVTRGTSAVSTSHKPSSSFQASTMRQLPVSTMRQKSSVFDATVQAASHESTAEFAQSRFSSLTSRFSAVQETSPQSTVVSASSTGGVNEYTTAEYHNGSYVNDTSDVMKTPVSGGDGVSFTSAALTTAVAAGIALGICLTITLTVVLIILRTRRKTENLQTSYACVQNEKFVPANKIYPVEVNYSEVKQPTSQPDSVAKLDEVYLLPHEQVVYMTSDDSSQASTDGDSLFDELVHIDTDMSSLLHVVDSRLAQNSHGSDDVATIDIEPVYSPVRDSSENQYYSDDSHEYDLVYVPHNDAAAMARRVDNDTSYIRTLQSRHNFSPYEEVCYGIRPLLLSVGPSAQIHQQPVVPPRTSSASSSRMVVQSADEV